MHNGVSLRVRLMRSLAGVALALVLLGGVAACGQGVLPMGPAAPPLQTTHGTPSVAELYLVGDPRIADQSLTVAFRDDQGEMVPQRHSFAPGEIVALQVGFMPGTVDVIVDGAPCGQVELLEAQEIDATLALGDECRVIVDAVHDGSEDHTVGWVSVHMQQRWAGAEVRLVSLDDPPNHVPTDLRLDETGFVGTELLAGRYRLTLVLADKAPLSTEFEVTPGDEKTVAVPGG